VALVSQIACHNAAMPKSEPTAGDVERHRAVYATPNLPPFEIHEIDDRLRAGRNPLTVVDVAELCVSGITHVLDLRENHEWRAPNRFGAEAVDELQRRGVERRNIVVTDMAAPSQPDLDAAVRWIEAALSKPRTRVFVHCRAGRERTAAILAALLVSRGATLEHALATLKKRAGAAPLPAQLAAVGAWAAARAR
jgi:rhodanese-related sulfurtransferase